MARKKTTRDATTDGLLFDPGAAPAGEAEASPADAADAAAAVGASASDEARPAAASASDDAAAPDDAARPDLHAHDAAEPKTDAAEAHASDSDPHIHAPAAEVHAQDSEAHVHDPHAPDSEAHFHDPHAPDSDRHIHAPAAEVHAQDSEPHAPDLHAPVHDPHPHDPHAPSEPDEAARLRAERDQWRDRHLRLAADFDNYRKRSDERMRTRWERAQADLVSRLLDPMDDLLRISELGPETSAAADAVLEGAALVERKFFRILEEVGVEVVDPQGEPFDPNVMEAMMRAPADSEDDDDVVERVFQKGYVLKGQLLRPARVSVYKAG